MSIDTLQDCLEQNYESSSPGNGFLMLVSGDAIDTVNSRLDLWHDIPKSPLDRVLCLVPF